MENIDQFLKRFKRIISTNEDVQKVIREVIEEVLHVKFQEKDFDLKNGVLCVHAKPIVKNEIYFQKDRIIKALHERGLLQVKDLR
jgi:predicted transcriptional regulator YheO